MTFSKILALVVLTAGLCLPAGATAQTIAPPGNSGVEQYLEAVPGATGNRTRKEGSAPVLPAKVREQLRAAGEDGEALDRLVSETAPEGAVAQLEAERSAGSDGSPREEGSRPAAAEKDEADAAAGGSDGSDDQASGSSSAAIGTALSGGSAGMGLVLPGIMLLSALTAVGLVLLRRRAS